jgi:hypothetical protein
MVELDAHKTLWAPLSQPIAKRQLMLGSFFSWKDWQECSFTLIFDDMVASIGPGVPITDERVNCQLNIDLEYPSGFQYSILSTEFRGYAGLDSGVTGTQEATYYFSGGGWLSDMMEALGIALTITNK